MSAILKNAFVVALCLSIGACAFKKEDSENQQRQDLAEDVTKKLQEEQKKSAVILKEANISAAFEELEEPGYYQLVLKWPEEVGTMEVFVDGTLSKAVSGRSRFQYEMKHSQKVKIRLRAFAAPSLGGMFLSEYEVDLESPKDFIVTTTFKLKNELIADVRRVYFLNGAQLFTEGYPLTIKTEKLYIQNQEHQSGLPEDRAEIVTFNQRVLGADSRQTSNSKIEIEAKSAEGTLRVAMIGVNGKDGLNAEDIVTMEKLPLLNNPALSGTAGKDGNVRRGGKACPPRRNMDVPCEQPEPKCMEAPTNGTDGQDGKNGYDGQDGAPGGGTGDLKISVEDHTNFSIEVYQKPGKGGRGGKGSAGQLGGQGGAPGNSFGICPNAAPGKKGQDGAHGKNGHDGKDGEIGTIETNVKITSNRS